MPPEWAPHTRRGWRGRPPATRSGTSRRRRGRRGRRSRTPCSSSSRCAWSSTRWRSRTRSGTWTRASAVQAQLDDAWMRDIGPTFVLDEQARSAPWTGSSTAGARRRGRAGSTTRRSPPPSPATPGATLISSPLVNEGGGIHVDGAGTVLVTETVQLDRGPQPGLGRGRGRGRAGAHDRRRARASGWSAGSPATTTSSARAGTSTSSRRSRARALSSSTPARPRAPRPRGLRAGLAEHAATHGTSALRSSTCPAPRDPARRARPRRLQLHQPSRRQRRRDPVRLR